ncbi:unnamed protein product [Debaryomyces tyrocola]|nr:unnamed protein product [Debaryomyces tyrocola]
MAADSVSNANDGATRSSNFAEFYRDVKESRDQIEKIWCQL